MTEPMKLPPEAQEILMKLQTIQQQMQSMAIQKETLMIQKMENDKALDELSKTKDTEEVFKAVGPILIKSNKNELEKELKEKNETAEVRLKTVEKQEKKLTDKAQDLQKSFQELLKAPTEKGTAS